MKLDKSIVDRNFILGFISRRSVFSLSKITDSRYSSGFMLQPRFQVRVPEDLENPIRAAFMGEGISTSVIKSKGSIYMRVVKREELKKLVLLIYETLGKEYVPDSIIQFFNENTKGTGDY